MRINLLSALAFSLAAAGANAQTNMSLTIQGTGDDIFNTTIFMNSCLKKKGWDTHVITSKMQYKGDKRDYFNPELEKVLGRNGLVTAPQQSSLSLRSPNGYATKFYNDSISKMTSGLKSGDQFFMQISAHGRSTCENGNGHNEKVQVGVEGFEKCDHLFWVWLPGEPAAVKISTKELVPTLKKLKTRGVRVAVDITSCYGGAAIKDFANAGICAHAYATPDNTEVAAVRDPTHTLFQTTAAACNGVKADQILNEIDLKHGACSKEHSVALKKAFEIYESTARSGPVSISTVFDQARARDRVMNQPIGTDGPFWAVGNFGILNPLNTALQTMTECRPVPPLDSYFNSFAMKVDQITERYLGGEHKSCKLFKPVSEFLKSNQGVFKNYLEGFKALNQELVMQDEVFSGYLNKAQAGDLAVKFNQIVRQEFIADMRKTFGKNAGQFRPEDIKALDDKARISPYSNIRALLSDSRSQERKNLVNSYFPDPTQLAQLELVLHKQSEIFNKDRKSLEGVFKDEVIPVERRFYQALKGSKEYEECLAKNPILREAKKSCEDFRIGL